MAFKINIAEGTQSNSATELLQFLKDAGKSDKDFHIHLDGNAVVLYTKGEEIPKEVMEKERTLYSADGKGGNSLLSKDVMGKARIAVYNALANEFSDGVANDVVTGELQHIFFPPEGNGNKAAAMKSLDGLAETLESAIQIASELKVGTRSVASTGVKDNKDKGDMKDDIDLDNIVVKSDSNEVKFDIPDTDLENNLDKPGSKSKGPLLEPKKPSVDPKDSSENPFAGYLLNNDDKVTDDADTDDSDDQPPVQLPFDNNTTNKLNSPTDEANNPTDVVSNPTDEANNPADEVDNPTDEVDNPTNELNNPTDDVDNPTDELPYPAYGLPRDDVSLEEADLKMDELPNELEGTPTKGQGKPQGSSSDDKKTAQAPSKDDFAPQDDLLGVPRDTKGLDIGEED